MQGYRERVRAAAVEGRLRKSEAVPNFSIEHAAVLVENLLLEANHSLDILTGHLNTDVYGKPEIVAAAMAFLQRPDTRMRILVEDWAALTAVPHPLLRAIASIGRDRVEMRVVPPHIRAAYRHHFAVADERSYRLEGDRDTFEASGRFGDVEGARILSQRFEEIWRYSPVPDLAGVEMEDEDGIESVS